MLPETLVVLILTLDQSGSCCAAAACTQNSATPANAEIIHVGIFLLITLLLRKRPGILPLWLVLGRGAAEAFCLQHIRKCPEVLHLKDLYCTKMQKKLLLFLGMLRRARGEGPTQAICFRF